LKTKWSKIRV